MSSGAADEATLALLRKSARLHWSGLTPEAQAGVRAAFNALDQRHDGHIYLQQLMQHVNQINANDPKAAAQDAVQAPRIFRYLDARRNGFLGFDEFVILHYLNNAGFHVCDACSTPVILGGYTCKACWDSPDSASTYDICHACFASPPSAAFSHQHSLSSFISNTAMYDSLKKDRLSNKRSGMGNARGVRKQQLVQCSVCEEYHCQDMEQGFLCSGQGHVAEMDDGSFVCEWCSSWLCNNCGHHFHARPSLRSPGLVNRRWLRTDLCCNSCAVPGSKTNLQPIFEQLESNKVLSKGCSTCSIKIKTRTLWEVANPQSGMPNQWSYEQPTSTNNFAQDIDAYAQMRQSQFYSYALAKTMIHGGMAVANLAP